MHAILFFVLAIFLFIHRDEISLPIGDGQVATLGDLLITFCWMAILLVTVAIVKAAIDGFKRWVQR